MEDEIRNINCYCCGKENPGIFFCNEDCHGKWMVEHPVSKKSRYTIKEMQQKVLEWRKTSQKVKEDSLKDRSLPVTYDIAKDIFG
jgi:hypothetical protein